MIAHTSAISPAPDSAAPVQSMRRAARVARLGQHAAPGDDRDHAERDVDDEDRPPPVVVEQDAADDGPERDAEARGRGPDPDRHRPLAGVGEDADQQRQGRGHDERGAGAHDRAGGDERVDAARVGGARRGGPEHREPGEQRAAAAEAVAERPGEEQQSGEHERVRVDHPLELAHVRVEVAHQRGEGDVHDRVVDHDREQAQAQHDQREPAAAVAAHDVTAGRSEAGAAATRRSRTRITTANAISQTLHRT